MLRFLKLLLPFLVLVAIHQCQAKGKKPHINIVDPIRVVGRSAEGGENDNAADSMPPDEEELEESPEDATEGAYDEYEKMAQESLVLTVGQMQALHKKIDSNRDGKITMEEAKKFVHDSQVDIGVEYSSEQVKHITTATSGKYTSHELLYGNPFMPVPGEEGAMGALDPDQELHHITFKVADTNNDGLLDEKELPMYFNPEHYDVALTAVAGYQLKLLDTNSDSKISLAELASSDDPAVLENMGSAFKELDKDGNGFLMVEEFKPYHSGFHWIEKELKTLFETADVNDDKHITASELEERHPALQHPTLLFLRQWADNPEL